MFSAINFQEIIPSKCQISSADRTTHTFTHSVSAFLLFGPGMPKPQEKLKRIRLRLLCMAMQFYVILHSFCGCAGPVLAKHKQYKKKFRCRTHSEPIFSIHRVRAVCGKKSSICLMQQQKDKSIYLWMDDFYDVPYDECFIGFYF